MQRLETDEDSGTERKTCQVHSFGKKKLVLGYAWKIPERVFVGEEGEGHSCW